MSETTDGGPNTGGREPERPEDARPDDGAEAMLGRYQAGALSHEERAALERRLLTEDGMAEALYADQAILAVLRTARAEEPGPVPGPPDAREAAPAAVPRAASGPSAPRRRGWSRALPLAAAMAAVVGLVALQDRLDSRRVTLRGGDGAGREAFAVRPLEPAGDVGSAPRRFAWTRSPRASAYRVRVYDAGLRLAGEAVTRDTTLAWGSVPALSGTLVAGSWSVTPLDSSGLELPRSQVMEFRVRP